MKFTLLATLTVLVLYMAAGTADAQTIRPRGAASAAPASTPAPATEPATTTPDAPAAEPEPATSDTPTTTEVEPVEIDLRQSVGTGEGTVGSALVSSFRAENNTRTIYNEVMTLRYRVEAANWKLKWGFGIIGLLLIVNLIIGVVNMRKIGKAALVLAMLGYGLLGGANTASAQTPTTPACTIRSITIGGGALVKEQDPVAITVNTRGCGPLKSVAVATLATDITFTEPVVAANRITAKLAATASALTGPASIKVTLADGTEVVSPDAVYLLVLDPATAQVRKDLATANANVSAEVTKVKAEVAKNAALLNARTGELTSKVNDVATSRPTTPEVQTLIAEAVKPLEAKIANLEAVTDTLRGDLTGAKTDIQILAQGESALAVGQATLANTKVKKGGLLGFGGMRPLAPEVATDAQKTWQSVQPTSK